MNAKSLYINMKLFIEDCFNRSDPKKKPNLHTRDPDIEIILLAGPSGKHCRCYGVVDVSAHSMFRCG